MSVAPVRVAFLDRDGTLCRDYPDALWRYVRQPQLLRGTVEGLRALQGMGYAFIIVTNQYLIGEGIITPEQYRSFHGALLNRLRQKGIGILDTFYCPHARSAGCACCKPAPGLVFQALDQYPTIDLRQSILCGDSPADAGLAHAVGLPFYAVGQGRGNTLADIACRLGK